MRVKNFFVYDNESKKIVLAGEYQFYINERSSEMGYGVYTERHKPLCILWQKKIYHKDGEKTLCYIAYRENDEWAVRRLSSIIIEGELQRGKKTKEKKIAIFFDMITGKEGSFIANL